MGKSYRKNVFTGIHSSKGMKEWRTQENRRLRHKSKQLINTCKDWDSLILPVINDFDTLRGSPQDGKKFYISKPALNYCQLYHQELMEIYGYSTDFIQRYYRFDGTHFRVDRCHCYSNKRNSYYWRIKRK